MHEGGISSPLIVHWPARVKAKGELRHQPGHVVDIMATCLDAAGAQYPAEHKGNRIHPTEGKSLVPAFEGKPLQREAIYWEHEGNRAVRQGKWKLVSRYPGGWELYDVEADRTELADLAKKHPEKVKELAALYEAWAKRNAVVPWGELQRGRRRRRRKPASAKKLAFDLKQGQDLSGDAAPWIAGRSVLITATVDPSSLDGVILAQGGSALGYALYLKDGKLTFATRHKGKLTVVSASGKVPKGQFGVEAVLAKDGAVTLKVGDKQVSSGKTPGPIPEQPVDGLQVGSDNSGAVGDYEAPSKFHGTIENMRLKLGQ